MLKKLLADFGDNGLNSYAAENVKSVELEYPRTSPLPRAEVTFSSSGDAIFFADTFAAAFFVGGALVAFFARVV